MTASVASLIASFDLSQYLIVGIYEEQRLVRLNTSNIQTEGIMQADVFAKLAECLTEILFIKDINGRTINRSFVPRL